MATITTTTNTTPFEYPGNRLVVKQIDLARHMALVEGSTANNFLFYRSTDGGANWSLFTTIVRANLVDIGSIFADNQGWLYWGYRCNESSADTIYIRRIETGASNKPDTGEILMGQAANGGVAGAAISGLSITSHFQASNGYHYVVLAHGITPGGGNAGVSLVCAQIDIAGNISDATYRLSGTRTWYYTDTVGRVGPSIDKEHSGDGYNTTSPNLWITFGRGNLRQIKVPWTGDGWSGSPGTTLIKASTGARDTMPGLWDGSRFLMVIPDPTTTDRVLLYWRNQANSSTTTKQSPAHTTGVVRHATMAYDYSTGNVRVYAVGTSTAVLYSIDFIRLTDSWGTWTAVSGSPSVQGLDNFGAKPGTYQDAAYMPYYATGTPTLTLTVTPQSQSYSPDIPTIDAPTTGLAQDVASSLLIDWTFSDPDPADTQSKFALSRQIGAAAIQYWRTSDNTWQATEQQNTSSTTNLTLTSAQWPGAGGGTDANHVYKVKVWDAANNPSAYSTGVTVVPSVVVNPAITSPTAAQVLTNDHVTLTWTATEQTKYRIILSQTSPGAFQAYDSGWVTDTPTRSVVVPYTMANTTGWTITLQTANNEGLVSVVQTRSFTVAYTPPATPTTVNSPRPLVGDIQVKITNPTPGGGQPTISQNEVWRRVVGTTAALRLSANTANNGTYNDNQAISGVAYEYQIVAVGSNGTSTVGAWAS
jgi:hypothetical protein